ncbi:bifunctional phosphopantothenoylcysteine decarboxylase/phosphopantothenate--cysteine ligase CoaBC [Lacibacter luteus]|uniref:Coenzyme A biosynthesis bifunctional protein CoaBC n=1 Tax=Lacibacter luteus TaxID=2508719 RepID=A0A4Q1CPT1_9BACT|nr:bifunctional phosphopantothenoylcysteine decarboxylase/phosphopantothenate--cysteine ligase CoaBC [Lacibacter luteus]RXK62815.1 bifunctional phosphopantothenoylcysteine decarboxylase/phosphopantothenate--cysteine ligase CoaBC [Lacibacter luteus]
MSLAGKKIVLGISGSIAAYKSILLVRLLIKEGADVKVMLTPAAKDFVSPLVLSTLSKNKVVVDLFEENSWTNHVELGRWADLMLIAPLSCNTLAKMATGMCDNLLLAVYLSATCPVMVAPAMDEDMWKHPATKNNIASLKSFGNIVIPVAAGELASGLVGEGRMAEPDAILNSIQQFFFQQNEFSGKTVLITAGPTYEAIDPVRFIGNNSSGKMGVALAEELAKRGARVELVLGPSSQIVKSSGINVTKVTSAEEMFNACASLFPSCQIAIMSAAVADYTPVTIEKEKIKKSDTDLQVELKRTKDILAYLGSIKNKEQLLVGFALETQNEKEYALNKLESKNADMIVLNSLNDQGAGFGKDTNKITIFDKNKQEYAFSVKSKTEVAKDIVDTIKQFIHV